MSDFVDKACYLAILPFILTATFALLVLFLSRVEKTINRAFGAMRVSLNAIPAIVILGQIYVMVTLAQTGVADVKCWLGNIFTILFFVLLCYAGNRQINIMKALFAMSFEKTTEDEERLEKT